MLRNQNGSTLLQVIFAAGLVTGSGYIIMSQQQQAKEIRTKQVYNQEVQAVIDQLQTALARAQNCTVTIAQTPIRSIKRGEHVLRDGRVVFEPREDLFVQGTEVASSGLILDKIEFLKKDEGSDLDIGRDFLRIRLKAREGKKMPGSSDFQHDFRLSYFIDKDGNRAGCYSEDRTEVERSVSSTCDGVYNPDTKKCDLTALPECTIAPVGTCSPDVWKCVGKISLLNLNGTFSKYDKCCRKLIPDLSPPASCDRDLPVDSDRVTLNPAPLPDFNPGPSGPTTDGGSIGGSSSGSGGCDPVDGGWSNWGAWSDWSSEVVNGVSVKSRMRSRTCTEPVPACGGQGCGGASEDWEYQGKCQPRDGGWSAWGPWSEWSSVGTNRLARSQSRTCSEPAPDCGGASCVGESIIWEYKDLDTCSAGPGGCIPSGCIDDTLYKTHCCSGAAVPGSTRCANPADYNTTWESCTQTCN